MDSPAPSLDLSPPPAAVRERWALHVGLFLATFATVLGLHLLDSGSVAQALTFAVSLLAILLCHEMGHYVLGRMYGVSISPPYFIPFPLGIGTLGAVIRIRSPIPTRDALVDIGAAGPIAGVVIAIPLLLWGTAHSTFVPVKYVAGLHLPGELSLWKLGQAFAAHGWPGLRELFVGRTGEAWSGDSLLTWGATRLLLGPTPAGTDVQLHPVAVAAWWGLLVTWLNLLPIGQLDGGHVMYALFGRRARLVGNAVHLGMVGLVIFASVMVIPWLLLTRFLVGIDHPPVMQPEVPLSRSRLAISALAIALLVLTFIPVPLEIRFTP